MMDFESKFWRLLFKQFKRRLFLSSFRWRKGGFTSPSPHFVKMAVLNRYGTAETTWVETGSYLGETSSRLAKVSKQVHSIEPEISLFKFVSWRYKRIKNLKFHYGTSEQILDDLVKNLEGDTCLWLDGHFSGDITFRGETSSPIIYELSIIEKYLPGFKQVRVLIDDVREFVSQSNDSSYPNIDYLVSWAQKNNLNWTIEHDIFVAGFEVSDKRVK
jgi:hypothetical protein